MYIKIYFTFTALLLLTAKGDPDPLTFITSTPATLLPSPLPLPEFEAKEIIAYLTQEQLEDLKSGRGILEPVLESQTEPKDNKENPRSRHISDNNYNDDQLKSLLEQRKKYIKTQSKLVFVENQNTKALLPAKGSNEEEPQDVPAQISWYPREHDRYPSSTAKLERNGYFAATSEINFATTSEKPVNDNYYDSSTERTNNREYSVATSDRPDNLNHKSINYYSVYNEKKGDNINIKIFHPTPKAILDGEEETESKKEIISNKQYILTPYLRKEEITRSQKYKQENTNEYDRNLEEEELEPKYAIRYRNGKHAISIQDLIKKQKAEVIAKRPVQIPSKVNTAKPRPYVLHDSQPDEIKTQKSYSLPLEFVRHTPLSIGDTEEEQPIPYEINTRASTPGSEQVYKIGRPYLVERVIHEDAAKDTTASPEKLSILGRIW